MKCNCVNAKNIILKQINKLNYRASPRVGVSGRAKINRTNNVPEAQGVIVAVRTAKQH